MKTKKPFLASMTLLSLLLSSCIFSADKVKSILGTNNKWFSDDGMIFSMWKKTPKVGQENSS